MAGIRPGIAPVGGSFALEGSIEKYSRSGRRALLLLWCKSPLPFWSFAAVNWKKSGRVGTKPTNNFVLLPI